MSSQSTCRGERMASRKTYWATFILLASFQAFASDLPNPSLTPGTIDPSITKENIQSTVCVKGYTKTVRPPASYTNTLKKRQMRQYGYADTNPKHYEEDHLFRSVLAATRKILGTCGRNPGSANGMRPRRTRWNIRYTAWCAMERSRSRKRRTKSPPIGSRRASGTFMVRPGMDTVG